MSEYFSKNLKYLRTIKKISQQDIADYLKTVNRSTVSRWENGLLDPNLGEVISLANLFGVTVSDLIGRNIKEDNLYNNAVVTELDELETLFLNNYSLLTNDDKDTIRFIIEKRVKENDN